MKKIKIKKTEEVVYYEKLTNGLEIYLLPNSKVKNFYITLSTKFGSIHTDFKYNNTNYKLPKGVAHFLEHILFNMPDGSNVFDYFSKLGANINAFTAHDVTCYEVFANSKFKENLEYLLTYVYTPYFTKEMISGEKGIITEEIKMIADNPNSEIVHGLFRNIFVKDERQYMVSGTVNDVKKITLKDVQTSYDAFYHPENMFLIITGNFKPEEAVAITSETLNNFEFNKYKKPVVDIIKEPFKVAKEYEEKLMPVDKHKVTIGIKIPKKNFNSLKLNDLELKLYLNLIMRVNFGNTSLIREEMISNGIITTGINNYLIMTDDYVIESLMVSTDYPDYFIKRIEDELKKLDITKEELDRKVKANISTSFMNFDDIEIMNNEIQDDILNCGDYVNNIQEYYRKLDLNTAKKVIDKLNNHITSITILKPKEIDTVL